jgi:hypothetical protein
MKDPASWAGRGTVGKPFAEDGHHLSRTQGQGVMGITIIMVQAAPVFRSRCNSSLCP